MNTRYRDRPIRPDDSRNDKDRAFILGLRTTTNDALTKMRKHYKRDPWRVVAIDRELARRESPPHDQPAKEER